jgi:pyruvate/2-oxoglutarate dehydrogenase complex dihydrolipoamide acyltransferase (E2) component
MFAKIGIGGSWGIPLGHHPLVVALGGIARRPGIVDDRIEIREVLSVTVLFDHDVIDGAPVAVFLQRLRELMESGSGLLIR